MDEIGPILAIFVPALDVAFGQYSLYVLLHNCLESQPFQKAKVLAIRVSGAIHARSYQCEVDRRYQEGWRRQ